MCSSTTLITKSDGGLDLTVVPELVDALVPLDPAPTGQLKRTVNLAAMFMMECINLESYVLFIDSPGLNFVLHSSRCSTLISFHTRLSAQPACLLSLLLCKLSFGSGL